MSESTEARTVGFYKLFHPAGKEVNFTVRGGTTIEEVKQDLVVLMESVYAAQNAGWSLTFLDGATDPSSGKEIAEKNRNADMWVRGVSRNGHPVLYGYINHDRWVNKSVTCYGEMIEQCPISQEDWDGAKIWEWDAAPTKDKAMDGNYIQWFSSPVDFQMYYDGGEFTIPNGARKGEVVKTTKPLKVLNHAPGGVKIEDGDRSVNQDPNGPVSTPVGAQKTAATNGGEVCAECHAPAGKPHATNCSMRDPGNIPGVTRGVKQNAFQMPIKKRSDASPRQKINAQFMVLGKAAYGENWDTVRAQAVTSMGVPSGSSTDLTDDQLTEALGAIKTQVIEAIAAWTPDWDNGRFNGILQENGYNGHYTGLDSLPDLPGKYLAILYAAADEYAADQG